MGKYLADTTILIDHLRGDKQAKDFLLDAQPAVSLVTLAELIQGSANKKELQAARKAVADLDFVPIRERISTVAIELMEKSFLSHNMQFLDALIAATAIEENLQLVTANTKHFQFIDELKVVDWASL